MNHEESKLQQQCVAWFRAEYPEFAMLLTHPINEGSKNTRVTGAIHKAEGTVAGVSDLLFFVPTIDGYTIYFGLGIEFKTKSGRQSKEQKDFQKLFEAAGYRYEIVRDKETFMQIIEKWIRGIGGRTYRKIKESYDEIIQTAEQKEKEHFYKVIGKK